MPYPSAEAALLAQPELDLQHAAGVGSGNALRPSGRDMSQLALQELIGHLRLCDIIDACTAAAPG